MLFRSNLDLTNWLNLQDNEYYGDWAKEQKFLDSDGFHPKYPEAVEGWVNQILIPIMLKENLLY